MYCHVVIALSLARFRKQCVDRHYELAKKSVCQLEQEGTPCGYDHHLNKDDFDVVGEVALIFEWIVLKCLYDARRGLLDMLWTFNTLARTVAEWKRACNPRLEKLTKYIRFH